MATKTVYGPDRFSLRRQGIPAGRKKQRPTQQKKNKRDRSGRRKTNGHPESNFQRKTLRAGERRNQRPGQGQCKKAKKTGRTGSAVYFRGRSETGIRDELDCKGTEFEPERVHRRIATEKGQAGKLIGNETCRRKTKRSTYPYQPSGSGSESGGATKKNMSYRLAL